MKQPKMYWKVSHKCYYANIRGKQTRLDPDEDKAKEILRAKLAETNVSADPFVSDVLQWFLKHHDKSAPRTKGFYQKAINSFSAWLPKRLLVSELEVYHVDDWIDEKHHFKTVQRKKKDGGGRVRTNELTSDNYRHNLKRAIRAVFVWAKKKGRIKREPLAGLELPTQTPRQICLSDEQYQEILKATPEGVLRDVIVVLRETGCRPQELRKIEARHFDRQQRLWIFPPSESKAGKVTQKPRFVALSDNAYAITARLAEQHPTGPLFRNSAGKPWTKDALARRFERLEKLLGFTVSSYVFRHSFATWAVKSGVNLLSLAATMGHQDTRMLAKVYAHVGDAQHLHATLRKINGQDAA